MANRETRVYSAVHSMSATQQPLRGTHPSDIVLIQQMVLLINLLSGDVRLMGRIVVVCGFCRPHLHKSALPPHTKFWVRIDRIWNAFSHATPSI